MQITIGEVINELMPYANIVESSICHGVPFVVARISTASNYTIFYMYVVQTGEHQYAACDCRDNINGERFFPTGGIDRPFIVEQDVVRSMFGINSDDDISYKYDTVVTGLSFADFITHLYERLSYYEIIRFKSKNLNIKIAEMGFTSVRIRRAIEEGFKNRKCYMGTIKDLIDIVIRRKDTLSLGGLKHRESNVIVAKLRDLGILITINENNCIDTVQFDKKKGKYE